MKKDKIIPHHFVTGILKKDVSGDFKLSIFVRDENEQKEIPIGTNYYLKSEVEGENMLFFTDFIISFITKTFSIYHIARQFDNKKFVRLNCFSEENAANWMGEVRIWHLVFSEEEPVEI